MQLNQTQLIQGIIYYLILYAIVIVNNYFKLKREEKTEATPANPQEKFDWRRVFYVSNEIIYTASGIFILLLEKQNEWVGPIAAFLLALNLVSTNLDSMSSKFSSIGKFITHLIIVIVVAAGTVVTFVFGLDKSPSEKKIACIQKDTVFTYVINIPYKDKTLIKHIGYEKMGDRCLSYQTIVICSDRKKAIKMAVENFWNDTLLKPILSKEHTIKQSVIEIDAKNVICEIEKE